MEVVSFVEHGDVFLAANPLAITEVDGGVIFDLAAGIFKLRVDLELKPYSFFPADFQMAWNLYSMKDFCYSLSYAQEVLDFNLILST